ncbi:hypothetical protein ZOD2009_14741 [Haladaptatus paucihalophilus DX253]|uniref:Uncharacterized protein n=1 Tax=Haladaptatus paucihalophilus DX253 TaxID=797209 RepID=E7QVW0_HALPU|nr:MULTISPECIES: hypothetical protein [Haladaptatus]EFW91373.1 hypothetical protein ZOD2009_14741 [Haladaptatus paucihalophilus DX253]GKZ14747.1 hypothetical protein HAL_26280 [Haladaptatus sp. T7]SHL12216.1 hypothetical protein SAMN05444342_3096 [Haladaptatus paucihalophilus DX253]
MFAHIHQYQHEQVADANRTAGESQTEDSVDKDAEEYFGKNMNEFDIETWETVEYEGDPIQRRTVALDDVVAISVPDEPAEGDDPDLPGRTIQVRTGGGETFVSQAKIVEVQDANPEGT